MMLNLRGTETCNTSRWKIKNLDLNIFPTDTGAVRPLIAESTETFDHLIASMHIEAAD
jgi:hypothetical protein